MPNVRLIIEYDGSRFHGWQRQPGLRTVQSELERVLPIVLREPIPVVHASGRTDAGVHARAQVVSFFAKEAPDLPRLSHAVSSLLRGDLSVVDAAVVPDSFHPRAAAKKKQYSYLICNRPTPPVLLRGRVWHIARPLARERMATEIGTLVGTHDFTSFRAGDCDARSPVKTIYEADLSVTEELVRIRFIGQGFLKQMVRIMVGTLADIGRGKLGAATVSEILSERNRVRAGITAPPYGLTLDWVQYD